MVIISMNKNLTVAGDISGNDASFNDISAVNFFSVGGATFHGNLTGNVTGNCSGTAESVTDPTQASITTIAGVIAVGTTLVDTTFSGSTISK